MELARVAFAAWRAPWPAVVSSQSAWPYSSFPDQGCCSIAVGVSILAVDYLWARRLLHRIKRLRATGTRSPQTDGT